jgi:hypothetical protein
MAAIIGGSSRRRRRVLFVAVGRQDECLLELEGRGLKTVLVAEFDHVGLLSILERVLVDPHHIPLTGAQVRTAL